MADSNKKENLNEEYSDEDNFNYNSINNDSLNNDNLDIISQDNDYNIETEEAAEEMELLEKPEESEKTEEAAPKKTLLQLVEKLANIAAGFFVAFADVWDYQMFFYFTAAILFLLATNVLSPWNKAIQRQTHQTNCFRIYFYLRTLIGIIIVICTYDIFLTEHYDTSAYSIILSCISILFILECMDEILEKYRNKIGKGKTWALLSSIIHFLLCVFVFGAFFWVTGLTLYLTPNPITIKPMETPTIQSVYKIGNQGHLLDLYYDTEANMEEDKLLLLMGDLEGKELSQLKLDEYLNYEKMKTLCKLYYRIDFEIKNASEHILSQRDTCINIIENQAFLIIDRGEEYGAVFRRRNIVYQLQLSKETWNMLKNYFAKLQG